MTRTISLVVALAGAIGLAVGWLASAPRQQVSAGHSHEVVKPPAVAADSGRREFPLRPEDVAEDRETPAVAVDADGRVLVAWAAVSGENERTIHLVRSVDGGKTFDQPSLFRKVPIYRYTSRGKDKAMAYSTHALPRLTAIGDAFQLGWVEAIDGGPEVHYYVATSNDGGKTFSSPESVHGKDASRPGFTALAASADGSLLASWLEGRNGRPQPFFAQRAAGSAGFDREQLVYRRARGQGDLPLLRHGRRQAFRWLEPGRVSQYRRRAPRYLVCPGIRRWSVWSRDSRSRSTTGPIRDALMMDRRLPCTAAGCSPPG